MDVGAMQSEHRLRSSGVEKGDVRGKALFHGVAFPSCTICLRGLQYGSLDWIDAAGVSLVFTV